MPDRRNGAQSPEEQVRALFEEAESNTAKAFEELVSKPSFGRLLALSAENTAALTRIAFDTVDLLWRNLRLAGRADIVRLSRQLHRTEDKLERVLQEVESLRDDLARERSEEEARIVSVVERVIRFPVNALEYTNLLLTTDDAVVGATAAGRGVDPPGDHAVPLSLV